MADICPFCGAPKAEPWQTDYSTGKPVYECYTVIDNGGDEERTRTHHCYMNQIRALQTGGDTDYSRGFKDGVEAMRSVMIKAVHNNYDYALTHPPMRHD